MATVASDSSEFQLFKKLANPMKVDFKKPRPPTPPPASVDPLATVGTTTFGGGEGAAPTLSFSQRLGSMMNGSGDSSGAVVVEEAPSYDHAPSDDEVEEEYDAEEEDEDEEEVEDVPVVPPTGSLWTSQHPSCAEEIEREKQGYLLELEKWKMQGIHTTKQFSMRDSLDDIQFEYDRIKMNMDTVSGVNLKDAMKLVFTGVELANSKMGPILQLDGWSSEVTSDMQRYNNCLEKIYKKHWRKGSMAPESELAFMVVGSMLVFHCKAKFFGNARTAPAVGAAPAAAATPPAPPSFFAPPPAAQPAAPTAPHQPPPGAPVSSVPVSGGGGDGRPVLRKFQGGGPPGGGAASGGPPIPDLGAALGGGGLGGPLGGLMGGPMGGLMGNLAGAALGGGGGGGGPLGGLGSMMMR